MRTFRSGTYSTRRVASATGQGLIQRYFRTHPWEVHDELEAGRPLTITQNGTAKVVVMDVDTYDRWRAGTLATSPPGS